MELRAVPMNIPPNSNLVLGQAHFIKTVEDLFEVIMNTVPGALFGIAFSEASGPCLIRVDGNDEELKQVAVENSASIRAGHTFVLLLRDAFPINVMDRIKSCPEVCNIFCATANPVQVLVAETEQGGGVIGVIDGSPPEGVEDEMQTQNRKVLLRNIGYKL